MLSGGEALEAYAVRNGSSVLEALAAGCPPRRTAGRMAQSPTCPWRRWRSATAWSSSPTRSVQEVIDVVAVVNALRVALPLKTLTDY
jgi:hypothetical protein